MISYWEKDSYTTYDYAIIGGGIVGLSTAISLREKEPRARIVVLERGLRPTGASTRNAGFACFGSLSELHEDMETLGDSGMVSLVEMRWKGLGKLVKRVGEKNLRYENLGGYELLRKNELHYLNSRDHINELLKPIFGKKVFKDVSGRIGNTGMNRKVVKALLYNRYEAQLHPGEMMRQLWMLAGEKRIEIMTGCTVKKIEHNEAYVRLRLRGRLETDKIGLKVSNVAVCTNGFTREFFPEVKLEPGRGQVIITEPIPDLNLKGTFHMDRGFYYFRNVGQRLLFGGGRNLEIDEETTTEFGENETILEALNGYLKNIILPGRDVRIAHQWSGIMAFGNNKKPIVKQHQPNIFLGVRMGGMGVAIGSLIGEKLAEMMTGSATI